MPVFHRSTDGSTALARAQQGGREVAFRLTREGALFLTEILGLRDGDEFRPTDLQLLIDRGWAEEQRPEPEPEPAPEPTPADRPGRPGARAGSAPAPAPPAAAKPEPARAAQVRRTRGREVALQVLYLTEQNPAVSPAEVERFITRRLRDPKLCEFARGLVDGVHAHQPALDETIAVVAENWRIDRMAAIDRNILRLGAFELLHCPEVPRRVAINEALELAKRYSTAQSSRFVNGILDRLEASESADPPADAPDAPADEP